MSYLQTLIGAEQRSARELALAYRIASTRVQRVQDDAQRLSAYGRTAEKLATALREAAHLRAAEPPKSRMKWLRVGAEKNPVSVLESMRSLEAENAARLSWLADNVPAHSELRALVSRAACASEVRQCWLRNRAEELRHA